jgi:hypothetical protein
MPAASDRHVAQLAFQRVSVLIADSAWLVIALDRSRVERRASSYGPCISEDREAFPITGSGPLRADLRAPLGRFGVARHLAPARAGLITACPPGRPHARSLPATLTVTATALRVVAMLILSDA